MHCAVTLPCRTSVVLPLAHTTYAHIPNNNRTFEPYERISLIIPGGWQMTSECPSVQPREQLKCWLAPVQSHFRESMSTRLEIPRRFADGTLVIHATWLVLVRLSSGRRIAPCLWILEERRVWHCATGLMVLQCAVSEPRRSLTASLDTPVLTLPALTHHTSLHTPVLTLRHSALVLALCSHCAGVW